MCTVINIVTQRKLFHVVSLSWESLHCGAALPQSLGGSEQPGVINTVGGGPMAPFLLPVLMPSSQAFMQRVDLALKEVLEPPCAQTNTKEGSWGKHIFQR